MPFTKKLTKLEMQIMETLWSKGAATIREIQEAFPANRRPAYTTIQTTVYRLEFKRVLRRGKKTGNAHYFEPLVTRATAQRRLIDDLLALFGGQAQPIMAHLIDSGSLSMADVRNAQKTLRAMSSRKQESPRD
jgi:predicted transcriptional regulator